MAIPFRPTGIGQNAAKEVFRISFDETLSQIPELHAWDDFNLNTISNDVFVGTTTNGFTPMIGAIGLTVAPSASWYPATPVVAAAVNSASLLIGNDGYILLTAAPPTATDVFFNFDFSFPDDVLPGDSMAFAIEFRFIFTGPTPTIVFAANDGGTEGAPIYTTLTTQPGGIGGAASVLRPSDAGGTGVGDTVTIPTSGEIFPDEIFVTAAA